MAENQQTKVCPFCAESIKLAAVVCPHCRGVQKQWSFRNPQVMNALWAAPCLLVFVGFMAVFETTFGPKTEFTDYRNEIGIVDSQISQRTAGSNQMMTVVGTLTNSSSIGWKDVGVEARFFDRSGKLIDVIKVNADDFTGVTVLPHGEAAFKIEGRAARSSADYYTNELNVRWARDVHASF